VWQLFSDQNKGALTQKRCPRPVFSRRWYYLHYYYCLMKNQYFKNCHLFEFPTKNIFVFLWKIRKPHIENRLWWPKMYDRIDKEKKKIILDRSNTKLLLIIIIIFCFKTFFLSFIISNVRTFLILCAAHIPNFDWYTNRFNEIMLERNKYENMCSKIFVVVF
jgi:hypothetical protein